MPYWTASPQGGRTNINDRDYSNLTLSRHFKSSFSKYSIIFLFQLHKNIFAGDIFPINFYILIFNNFNRNYVNFQKPSQHHFETTDDQRFPPPAPSLHKWKHFRFRFSV